MIGGFEPKLGSDCTSILCLTSKYIDNIVNVIWQLIFCYCFYDTHLYKPKQIQQGPQTSFVLVKTSNAHEQIICHVNIHIG